MTFIEFSKKLGGVLAKISGKAPWMSVLGPKICCDRATSPGLTCWSDQKSNISGHSWVWKIKVMTKKVNIFGNQIQYTLFFLKERRIFYLRLNRNWTFLFFLAIWAWDILNNVKRKAFQCLLFKKKTMEDDLQHHKNYSIWGSNRL